MTNLESLLKSRDITLSTKVRLVEAMVFPVVMYGCDLGFTVVVKCTHMTGTDRCQKEQKCAHTQENPPLYQVLLSRMLTSSASCDAP